MLSVICDKTLCFRIIENNFVSGVFFKIICKSFCIPFCHSKVVQKIISAVFRRSTGNTLIGLYLSESSEYKLIYLLRRTAAPQYQVKSRKTAHRSPVNDFILPLRIIAKKGRYDMLKRMHCRRIYGRFYVWSCKSYIVGGDSIFTDSIRPARKNAGNDISVID